MKVEVVDLSKHYGPTKAVDGINFEFEFGQVYGFVGPNGAGKTTTMRVMATLEEPTSGDVRIAGHSVTQDPEKVQRIIGYMPDHLPAHRDITVTEFLDFFARAHGLKGAVRRSTLAQIQAFTGLNTLREKSIHALSKGMKQRVSLARALVHDPQVLVMDEPAAGLDPKARVELRELIRALAEQGKAIFISSHILGELAEMCDGTVIIEQGKILRAGKVETLIQEIHTLRTFWVKTIGDLQTLYAAIAEMPGVEEADILGGEVRFRTSEADLACADMLRTLIDRGLPILEFRKHKADLEEVFMNITRGEVS